MTHPMQPTDQQCAEWWIQAYESDPGSCWTAIGYRVARLAYAAGADVELAACCDHLRNFQWGFVELPDGTKMHRAVALKEFRRPSTALQQALTACATALAAGRLTPDEAGLIRAALEQQA